MNTQPSQQQTTQQKRAAFAYDRIQEVPADAQKSYAKFARDLPAMILKDGLGASLAFVKAKSVKKNGAKLLLQHLDAWLKQEDFLAWVIKQDSLVYRQKATEVLAYMSWIKRFVEAAGWEPEE